jgi:hypothetical protein
MLSYIAMEMPKTAFDQPIDYINESNKYSQHTFPRWKRYSSLFAREFSIRPDFALNPHDRMAVTTKKRKNLVR